MNRRKIMDVLMSGGLMLSLSACGQSDTDLVKKGIMKLDKTLTVGEAFDAWSDCKSKEWAESKEKNGQRIVAFNCETANVESYMGRVKSIVDVGSNSKMEAPCSIVGHTQTFRWTINKDDSFQLLSAGTHWEWADGKSFDLDGDLVAMVKSVYANEVTFDPEELEANGNALRQVTAANTAMALCGFYFYAK